MDDLGDLGDPWIAQFETRDQGLERAAIPLVGELAPDGVEPHLARRRLGALRIGEAEASRGIDEATDEPGRGDAVDVDSLAGNPGQTRKLLEALGFRILLDEVYRCDLSDAEEVFPHLRLPRPIPSIEEARVVGALVVATC